MLVGTKWVGVSVDVPETCEFHELVDGEGAGGHEFFVQSGGGLGAKIAERSHCGCRSCF